MLFAVLFTDKVNEAARRAEHLAAHINWLQKHKAVVLVGGSLRTEPGAVPKGGLWIVEAPSKEAIFDLMKSDPFYACGLRESVEVLLWSKALDQRVLV